MEFWPEPANCVTVNWFNTPPAPDEPGGSAHKPGRGRQAEYAKNRMAPSREVGQRRIELSESKFTPLNETQFNLSSSEIHAFGVVPNVSRNISTNALGWQYPTE